MDLSPADLVTLMQSATPHAVLDLRERAAYERGHIFRSTSLPRRLLEFRLPVLVTAAATPIVLVDDDGRLAALAAPTLAALGYRDVRTLAGGLAAWRAAGLPTVEAINVPGGELVLRIGDLVSRPDTPIVVHCGGRTRSYIGAAATLHGLGYTGARVLEGGTRAWQEAGLPVETGATKLLDEADDVVLKPYDKGRAAMEAYLRWEEQLDEDGQSPHALK